jgi:glutathione S-transferase
MILIGQYDSPYVRRVGIALRLYGIAFEHRPWSVFGDGELVRAFNPVMKVPVLTLPDGDVIIESHMMLDYLDGTMPEAERLFPVREPERHRALKVAALGMGLADKAVNLFYEQRMHEAVSESWASRCEKQIRSVAEALEKDCPDPTAGAYWLGDRLGHADIAIGVALRFTRDALPGVLSAEAFPRLLAFGDRLEGLEVFSEISQAFVAPK